MPPTPPTPVPSAPSLPRPSWSDKHYLISMKGMDSSMDSWLASSQESPGSEGTNGAGSWVGCCGSSTLPLQLPNLLPELPASVPAAARRGPMGRSARAEGNGSLGGCWKEVHKLSNIASSWKSHFKSLLQSGKCKFTLYKVLNYI